jgi:phosphonate transport system substrate-binding protein
VTYHFAISPDVHARNLTDWFVLNTRLQRLTGEAFRATIFDDFTELHSAYAAGQVDLVFANAADTALLVRDHGFQPVAGPAKVADEAAVVVAEEGPLLTLADLSGSLSVAATDAPDVERICRILLEPADLGPSHIALATKRNYIQVAKAVVNGEVQCGFFLRAAFDELSRVTQQSLRVLISSQIYVVRHCLLAAPSLAHHIETMATGLVQMAGNPADEGLLEGLGAANGWEPVTMEETQFMIDLMDALGQG